MWYIIIGIIVIALLWQVGKWLLQFMLKHWQIPVGVILGYFSGYGLVGVAVGVGVMYFLTLIVVGMKKYIRKKNEKKLRHFLSKKCSRLGFVTKDQLAENANKYREWSYETSFYSIIESFLRESTIIHYDVSKNNIWKPVFNYLEKRFSEDREISSIDMKDVYKNCYDVFMWTRNVSENEIMLKLFEARKNDILQDYDIQNTYLGEGNILMISSKSNVTVIDGDSWG